MKKTLTSVLTLAIAIAALPVTTLAADYSDPVTKNGERLQYNTPYYLKEKNSPDKGGITFERWGLDDFVLFAHSSTDNGTPIIFENNNGANGFIQSNDEIRIKSTKVNEPGYQYWAHDRGTDSVYLNYDNRTDHRIYGSSTDNSIGIGSFEKSVTKVNRKTMSLETFREYQRGNSGKAWMRSTTLDYVYKLGDRSILPLYDRQTPFEVSE
ncbi:hypothetical protein [Bacillus sp. CDB3]|uniref:hypothetical protein n=1 Tax=Bacillus sp. CDB3 TaxID=360310 RepID=UPI0009D87B65|nr:hypothetical protein [Bacillus sp. CDB3]OQR53553.1 hypothetical protein CDB3_29030 [Bacillus sp. CDB3]